jgi:hypothetical protein
VNWEPRYDTIFFGTPWRHTIWDMYNSTNLAPEYVILVGIKWVTLLNRSMITQIESYPAWVRGNPMIKSIPISIQEFLLVATTLQVSGALSSLSGRYRKVIRIQRCLSLFHATNIRSLNPYTSWCCQGESNMPNHGLL